MLYNSYKWSVTFKNCELLYCIPVTYIVLYINYIILYIISIYPVLAWVLVQFSLSVVSDSLWPYEPQHTRPAYPWPTARVYWNPCPLSRWCHPTILSCRPLLLPSVFPSIRVFSSESALPIRWPNWNFRFNIRPSNEHSGLISFRMDWLDLLAVQGTLKSITTVEKHQFFGTQLSL